MPRSSRIASVILSIAMTGVLASPGLASQVVHLDTQSLTTGSNDIVIGEVERVVSRWNETRTKILTEVTLRLERSLKGGEGETLVLTQLGGEVDGMKTTVAGGPLFAPGEEVLLFIWRDPRGRAQVNGLAQGKFEISRDAASGRRYVQRALPGLAVRDSRSLAAVPAGRAAPRIALDEMVGEIERAMSGGGR